ncbi:hypothetical protein J2Z48_000872 [Croceifilum oryzae]|uniref:Uncharacterized protein n=1 Tax=Croceifilum oryzae TaxID=1553429 RepID=A0AAJ1TD51_9BACL|nr:hypothetical protein [Croceifilum oryzae]MDQ0416705.1 hypothetical protein [Croceifilum oryzae]
MVTLSIYREIWDKANETENRSKAQIWIEQIVFCFIVAIGLTCLVHFFGTKSAIIIYFFSLFLLQSSYYFVTTHVYESTSTTISFAKSMPVSVHRFFWYYVSCNSNSWVFIIIDSLLAASVLLYFDADFMQVVMLLVRVQLMNFVWSSISIYNMFRKGTNLSPLIFKLIFFAFLIIIYNVWNRFHVSFSIDSVMLFVDMILVFLSVLILVFYPYMVQRCLVESAHTSSSRLKVPARIVELCSALFPRKSLLGPALKIHLLRLLRSEEYLSKMLGIGIILFFVKSISYIFLGKSDSKDHFDLLYPSFMIVYFSFNNLRVDYQLEEKHNLLDYPIANRLDRLGLNIIHGVFVFLLGLLFFSVEILSGMLNPSQLLNPILLLICLYIATLIVKVPKGKLKVGQKLKVSFFCILTCLSIEIPWLIWFHFIYVKLLLLGITIVWAYLRTYRRNTEMKSIS